MYIDHQKVINIPQSFIISIMLPPWHRPRHVADVVSQVLSLHRSEPQGTHRGGRRQFGRDVGEDQRRDRDAATAGSVMGWMGWMGMVCLMRAKRREFSGKIPGISHVITNNNHPSNPQSHPFPT
jgi:hypothetical protein